MRNLLLILVLIALVSCSFHRVRNESSTVDLYGVELYKFNVEGLREKFPGVVGKTVIYRDSYIGNFTQYYSPEVLTSRVVLVPQVTCYSAGLDFPEEEYEKHSNHVRCRYYEVHRYFVDQPYRFYEIQGNVSEDVARKIASSWYALHSGDRYISYITRSNGNYYVHVGGEGCTRADKVVFTENGHLKFEDSGFVSVCS